MRKPREEEKYKRKSLKTVRQSNVKDEKKT